MLGDMQLAALIGSDALPLPEGGATEIAGLTADSRAVKPGYLFAALPGTKLDGTAFIAQALEKGAAALLVPQGSAVEAGVPVIADRNPRRRLAHMAARFFGAQPRTIAAVTGTNGKTSVATFLRQIWAALGEEAASLGTLGIASPKGERPLGYTTPDPVALQAELAALAKEGVTHLAMEASSHGLAQYRLDGAKLTAAGFTNITRDHMDYHASFDDYLYAKLRLFGEVMGPGGVAVINADSAQFAEFEAVSWARGHRVISVGRKGRDICLVSTQAHARGQTLALVHDGDNYEVKLPLVGGFQASNALVAAGLAIGCGADAAKVFAALEKLTGAKGRMEEAAHLANGASVYIDYAHTPDALENV
ncbi:MAG: UDP-N-acetylmuramoyl-L-alanyl-D-glutamate--2,6-diaminopimelate ligase, partial [Parvibaculum sp.]